MEAIMQEQQREADLAALLTSATTLYDGVLYIRSPSLVRHVIGKGGATIATLAENAGLDKKPFFSPEYGGFDVYRLPPAKAIELQKEVERFLREFLGEAPPTPNPIAQSMAEPANVNFYSALLDDDREAEKAHETREARAPARGVRLSLSFRQKGNIESRKYHAKKWLERRGYEERAEGTEGGEEEEDDALPTITLDEYELGRAPKKAVAAARKAKRAPAAPTGTPMRRTAADQYVF
jgi:hypothetical protein